MRLIDADMLLDDLRKNTSTYVEDFVRKIIDRQPTVTPKKMVTRQERYEIEVGVCNSLNAQAGRFRYSDPWLSGLLLRAQETINKLLEELGEEEGEGEGNG